MSEPEEVILDGAHHATTAIARLWRRHGADTRTAELRLADVRRRLELLMGAMFSDPPSIGVAEPPAVPNWFARVALRIPSHLLAREPISSTDGRIVRLPRVLDASDGPAPALARYRSTALCLAAKAMRGSARLLGAAPDALVRDLFELSESAAADRWLATTFPGLHEEIRTIRAQDRLARPALRVLSPLERRVEDRIRRVLSGDPAATPFHDTPGRSLAWAIEEAHGLRKDLDETRDVRYRGLPPVAGWGVLLEPSETALHTLYTLDDPDAQHESVVMRTGTLPRRPRVRAPGEDEDDGDMGMWMTPLDDPQESVEDPMGLQRPTDRDDDADAGDLADSLSELPEARLVSSPEASREILVGEDPPGRTTLADPVRGAHLGIVYPEWDYRVQRYREGYVVAHERPASIGDPSWASRALARLGPQRREVRRHFERLRPRRTRLARQPDGSELDLDAVVTAHADLAAGYPADDRLHTEIRPARRDLSILLLVDVSGSTDSWVADTRRIVDVEKEALLLVCEALDALGDAYAVMAFSGEGPRGVSVRTVKGFAESNGPTVRGRIAGLEPDRFTRVGAAIRHATAALSQRRDRHRLLLILSDGKPNDVDLYEGRYGIEDTRQAVAEARLAGLDTFCVTVDRAAPDYAPRIFGPGGYSVLRHTANLPIVLVDVLRTLLRR